jgi:phosphopantetheine adenylyltransferase
MFRLLVNANVVSSSLILVTLVMDAIRSSETSVLTRTTRCQLLRKVLQLLVTVNVDPSSLVLVTLVMDAIRSSETSVLTRTTRCQFLRKVLVASYC